MKIEIKGGLLSIINDFLTKYWPDLEASIVLFYLTFLLYF